MTKREKVKKTKNVGELEEGSTHKSLPLAMFEEFAKNTVRLLVDKLPSSFAREDLVQILHTYLDLSVRRIELPGRFRLKIRAIDIAKYCESPKYPKLVEQADFRQWAEPLLTD